MVDKKLKITVLGPLPPWKGVSAYMLGFVEALGKVYDVEVIDFKDMYPKFIYPGGEPKQPGVHTPTFAGITSFQLLSWRNPFTWIKAGISIQGNVLHMQYRIRFLAPIYIVVGCIAKCLKKIPVVLTIHNVQPHEKNYFKLLIDKCVYLVADHYIVHSQDNKKQLSSLLWSQKPIDVMSHGIILPAKKKVTKLEARTLLGLGDQKKILLFFGNVRQYKGLHYLLASLKQLVQYNTNYFLIIAGKSWDDRKQYQLYIDTYNLNPFILRLDEFLDDERVAQVFSASDLLLLPYTHFDAQSGVVALGLGYEIPMIVSNLGGLTSIISNEQYIWRDTTIDSLTHLILTTDTRDARAYVKNIKQKLDWKVIIYEYYRTMINHIIGLNK